MSGASPSPDALSLRPAAASAQIPGALALVPVVGFWSGRDWLSLGDIRAAVAGSHPRFDTVLVDSPDPEVLADTLGVDGRHLFGGDRVTDLAEWPLTIPTRDLDAPGTFDLSSVWTLAAAGDVMLDREVYRQSLLLGKGPDHPWRGGWARITSRTCCLADGGNAITAERVGERGEVRRLIRSADIALVNHEGPAPDDFA